jgi:hypothetical protein
MSVHDTAGQESTPTDSECGQAATESGHWRLLACRATGPWAQPDAALAHDGRRLGKSRIGSYEDGVRRMGIETPELLAGIFGDVSPALLLCLTDVKEPLGLDERELL